MAQSFPSSNSSGRVILFIMGLLVIAALGYFATRYFTQKQDFSKSQIDIETYKQEILELEVKIKDFERTMEDKNMDLAEKEKLLNEKYQELESMVVRLQGEKKLNRVNLSKMKQLETTLSELQAQVEQYRTEINALQSDNQTLTGKLDVYRDNETRLRSQFRNLEERHEAQSKELDQTVRIASVLKTKNIQFFEVRKSGKELEETTFSRGKLKILRMCFVLLENKIAQQGIRDIYVVIENPDGSINANFESGTSGSFSHSGNEQVYTVKSEANYRQQDLPVCMNYQPVDQSFSKGEHRVSVYSEGYLIGQSSFTVK